MFCKMFKCKAALQCFLNKNLIWLTRRDFCKRKKPNTCVSVDSPFLSLAIWLTTVVHKTGFISLGPGINNSILPETTKQHIMFPVIEITNNKTSVVVLKSHLVQCKHVEIADIVLLSMFNPGTTFFLINHLSNIFVNKSSLGLSNKNKEFVRKQTGQTKTNYI